jgi:alanyl-tRNA synthetase
MGTIKTYYRAYDLDRIGARILEIRDFRGKPAVVLDETIFYPEGGGQSADRGTINGIALSDVQEEDGVVYHILDTSPDTPPGAPEALAGGIPGLRLGPAELRLDMRRRRDFAVQHTAQHLLSATILRLCGGPTVSMHLGDGECTIDVDLPDLAGMRLDAVEEAVQDIIEADYPLVFHWCPPENIEDFPLRKQPPAGEESLRVVEIDGYDYSPCCGTHLRSTGEIGILKILGAEKYKGMTRVGFIAGRRVLSAYGQLRRSGEAVSKGLKVPLGEIDRGVAALQERFASLERTAIYLREQVAQLEAERILREIADQDRSVMDRSSQNRAAAVVRFFGDRTMDDALRIGRALQKAGGAVILVASGADRKVAALCSRNDLDLRPLLRELVEAHGGKGGGSPSFYQGAFNAMADLEAFLAAARLRLAESAGGAP